MTIGLGTLIAVLGTIAGIMFGYLSQQRQIKKEVQEDAVGHTELKTNLEYIKRGVDDIRIDLKAQENRVGELAERVIRVEESTKQAHKRLDAREVRNG